MYKLSCVFSKIFFHFVWLALFFPLSSQAKSELVVAVGLAKPPYVIQHDNSGFELDMISYLFKQMGYSTKFVYTSFGHSPKMLAIEEVDAVLTTSKKIFPDESKLSDSYVTYQNVAISLAENKLKIDSIPDLGSYTMASFQKADKVLGKAFANAVDRSPLYLKVADQSQQPLMLTKNRVEVLVMDVNIFNYFVRKLNIPDSNKRFTVHYVFPPSRYKAAFKNDELREKFNQQLKSFKSSEEYNMLKTRYGL